MKSLVLAVCCLLCALHGAALTNVRFNDESRDTTRINEILIDAAARQFANSSERNAYIASRFTGTPYAAATLEHTPEMLTVNLDSLDCTTFVETVLAMSYTLAEGRSSWRDFVYNLERLRYRGGQADGYASRLHYVCDWMVDNIHRGNIEDATRLFPRTSFIVRTIDFMSSHRDRYPALADDDELQRIKNVEIGYRSHRFPYIKTSDLAAKDTRAALRNGDAVAIVSSLKDLDVSHLGFAVTGDDGLPHLLHASSAAGEVTVDPRPLADALKRNRTAVGIRVIRLKD